MPNWTFSDEFIDDLMLKMKKAGEKLRLDGKCFLGEQEHPETSCEVIEDNFLFAERLIGRKLTNAEKYALIGATFTNPIRFKRYPLYEKCNYNFYNNYKNYNYYMSILPSRQCCKIVQVFQITNVMGCNTISKNNRTYLNLQNYVYYNIADERLLYCVNSENSFYNVDQYIEELKHAGVWYILLPIKINPDDLLFYKDIHYPWDDSKEVTRVGDSVHDIYEKSRGCHFKRSQMVQK